MYRYITLIFCILFSINGLQAQNRITINIPTPEQEADQIWRTLRDIAFFEKHNYQLSLPKNELIDDLKQKSRANRLSQNDYESLKKFVKTRAYKKSDYLMGYEKIEQVVPLLNKMVTSIGQSRKNWDFKEYDVYQVNLTLYGPGGSYDPDNGSILIFTTLDGRFKQYDNPVNTLIHEIVHIGMENSIMAEYKVPHPLKERIVDTFVWLSFGELLPDYRIQNMGDKRIDDHLKERKDLEDLAEIVKAFTGQ
ncbi:hypothetical protein [Leptobacterium flavescens]|uniref:hypothetical protein n=1 Tax=Leptobacterium flavescens TaxID=472055 RepID=UPI001954B38E|nr:hypothetical protein [Leptobacterium flavescens]